MKEEALKEAQSRGYGKFNRDFQNGFVQGAERVDSEPFNELNNLRHVHERAMRVIEERHEQIKQIEEALTLHPVCESEYCGYRGAVHKISKIVGW